ncbi:transcription initiation factor IIB [archaeon]|nr:transcription initiation factor IIB [archaeon]
MALKLQCECGNTEIITDTSTGEQICMACGTVLTEASVELGPEWRAFNSQQKDTLPRAGAPLTPLLHDKGLSTTISWRNQDARGRPLTREEKQRQNRLRKWQHRTSTTDSFQRNLTKALSELTRISDELKLPKNTSETAAIIYRKAAKKGLIKGRAIQSVVAASVYMACRQCQVIRSLDDVAKVSTITRKEAAKNYRYLYKHLDPEVPQVNKDTLITKFVSALKISGSTEQFCRSIIDLASEKHLTVGRAPDGITAAALYIACKLNVEDRTQSEIVKAAKITEVTIRNRYKELMNELDFEVLL